MTKKTYIQDVESTKYYIHTKNTDAIQLEQKSTGKKAGISNETYIILKRLSHKQKKKFDDACGDIISCL